jgi:hypothetical protein
MADVATAVGGVGSAVAAGAALLAIVSASQRGREDGRDRRLDAIAEGLVRMPAVRRARDEGSALHLQLDAVTALIDRSDFKPTPDDYATASAQPAMLRASLSDPHLFETNVIRLMRGWRC